jgi:hypothetical protein
MVFDELKEELYSDLETRPRVKNFTVQDTHEGTICTFEKTFEGADFTVHQKMIMTPDHLRWEVQAVKLRGADRSLRMVQFLPLPVWEYQCWAPMAEAPIGMNPWRPFQINYGMADAGSVGNSTGRTTIPMTVFYSGQRKNALCLVSPFEIPAVRIRFKNNVSIEEDFHWNSRNYKLSERPYLQVVSEYLGLRDSRPARAGLLLTVQPARWRPSLGWVYEQYREYFDPAPGFEPFDGVFVVDFPFSPGLTARERDELCADRYDRGIRWEELHGHFTHYGQMIPPETVENWLYKPRVVRGHINSRGNTADHVSRARKAGIGTFVYFNTTESEWWYASEAYPEDIARDERGNTIGAFRADLFPDDRSCWLMCADPESTQFGRDLVAQAKEMLRAYPDMAGFFWDVYARTFRFDFAHDDGITMVNNKPAYFPIFMFTRMIEDHIVPMLRGKGKFITCNKPTMVQACKGIDGIMARERTPAELKPEWLIAQSYLGLNRHVMILDREPWRHPELLFLNCLRYGFFFSEMRTDVEGETDPEIIRLKRRAEEVRAAYQPLIERFKGKKWVFHPRALSLPRMTDGNIFRLKNGSVMIALVSIWRVLNHIPGRTPNLELTCRLPDAAEMTKFTLIQPDIEVSEALAPLSRAGDAITFRLREHGLASVILLEP